MTTEKPDLVLVDFDDTLVDTAPRFAQARDALFTLLKAEGFDPAVVHRVHHHEVDPVMRARHGFGPRRMGVAFRETYRTVCERGGVQVDAALLERCGALGEAVAGTPPPLTGALDALKRLVLSLRTVLYTQSGDADYQMGCLRDSGALEVVGEARVKVVPVKTAEALRQTLDEFGIHDPGRACMVGNSLRSDINPALEIGARAILVEVARPWQHDVVEPLHNGFPRVPGFSAAVELLLGSRQAT